VPAVATTDPVEPNDTSEPALVCRYIFLQMETNYVAQWHGNYRPNSSRPSEDTALVILQYKLLPQTKLRQNAGLYWSTEIQEMYTFYYILFFCSSFLSFRTVSEFTSYDWRSPFDSTHRYSKLKKTYTSLTEHLKGTEDSSTPTLQYSYCCPVSFFVALLT
jgi:hypothetical protein